MLSRRLRDADAKRVEFAAFNTIARVAVRLLELCERFGREEGGRISDCAAALAGGACGVDRCLDLEALRRAAR